jgi:hypothetical protein
MSVVLEPKVFTRVLHLYPYMPFTRYGGTLRLLSSIEGSRQLSRAVSVYCFDAGRQLWSSVEISEIGRMSPEKGSSGSAPLRLKRRIFPSTLFESGRKPARSAVGALEEFGVSSSDLVVLHTSYLSSLVPRIQRRGAAAAVDVHDLVWRAHRTDAEAASAPLSLIRRAYAVTVRAREEPRLTGADALAVAGYADCLRLQRLGAKATWVPTGLEASPVAPPAGTPIRVGLIGNYNHSATRDSAERLLRSDLARDPDSVTLVFAGIGFDALSSLPGIDVLGPVPHVEDFYAVVDCIVVPVASGSGAKIKLAEGILAERPVITTKAGAEGYPPDLQRHFVVEDDLTSITPRRILEIVASHNTAASRVAFDHRLGIKAAADAYAAALSVRDGREY